MPVKNAIGRTDTLISLHLSQRPLTLPTAGVRLPGLSRCHLCFTGRTRMLLVYLWIAVILTPFWRQRWVFRSNEIVTHRSLLGLGWRSCRPLPQTLRLELRRISGSSKKIIIPLADSSDGRRYVLAIVDGADGQDVLEIDDLTEAEVRWIASELFLALAERPMR